MIRRERLHAEAGRYTAIEQDAGDVVVRLVVVHAIHTPTVVRGAQIVEDGLLSLRLVIRQIEYVQSLPVAVIDTQRRIRACALDGAAVHAAQRAARWRVLLPEPRQVADRVNAPARAADHPAQDIEVVR